MSRPPPPGSRMPAPTVPPLALERVAVASAARQAERGLRASRAGAGDEILDRADRPSGRLHGKEASPQISPLSSSRFGSAMGSARFASARMAPPPTPAASAPAVVVAAFATAASGSGALGAAASSARLRSPGEVIPVQPSLGPTASSANSLALASVHDIVSSIAKPLRMSPQNVDAIAEALESNWFDSARALLSLTQDAGSALGMSAELVGAIHGELLRRNVRPVASCTSEVVDPRLSDQLGHARKPLRLGTDSIPTSSPSASLLWSLHAGGRRAGIPSSPVRRRPNGHGGWTSDAGVGESGTWPAGRELGTASSPLRGARAASPGTVRDRQEKHHSKHQQLMEAARTQKAPMMRISAGRWESVEDPWLASSCARRLKGAAIPKATISRSIAGTDKRAAAAEISSEISPTYVGVVDGELHTKSQQRPCADRSAVLLGGLLNRDQMRAASPVRGGIATPGSSTSFGNRPTPKRTPGSSPASSPRSPLVTIHGAPQVPWMRGGGGSRGGLPAASGSASFGYPCGAARNETGHGEVTGGGLPVAAGPARRAG